MADEEAVAEAARVQAEARRKRILEKGNKRMAIVSGEQALDPSEKEASSANAARIRAARQRARRKKAVETTSETTTPTADAPATASAEGEKEEEVPASSSSGDADASSPSNDSPPETKVAPVPVVEDSPEKTEEPEPVPAPAADQAEEPAPVPVAATDPTPEADVEPTASSDKDEGAGKKKYVGVAKMRRKMLLKKKQESESTTSTSVSSSERSAVVLPVKPVLLINTFPIYMHIFTVLLLFLAGLDVGLQQFQDDVVVHPQDALSHYGLPLIHRSIWANNNEGSISESTKKLEELQSLTSDVDDPNADPDTMVDEFHEPEEEEEEYEPNIDPLFRVDLDKLTEGPGFLNQIARGAVGIHRLFLKVIWEMPKNLIQTILGIPRALLNTPPILCIVALILRQFVSKKVLGASLPGAGEGGDGDKGTKDASGGIDPVAMMKNMGTSFVTKTFPNAVKIYEAFTHLRSDMYIVLCGVFLGLAWSHMFPVVMLVERGEGGDQDEL